MKNSKKIMMILPLTLLVLASCTPDPGTGEGPVSWEELVESVETVTDRELILPVPAQADTFDLAFDEVGGFGNFYTSAYAGVSDVEAYQDALLAIGYVFDLVDDEGDNFYVDADDTVAVCAYIDPGYEEESSDDSFCIYVEFIDYVYPWDKALENISGQSGVDIALPEPTGATITYVEIGLDYAIIYTIDLPTTYASTYAATLLASGFTNAGVDSEGDTIYQSVDTKYSVVPYYDDFYEEFVFYITFNIDITWEMVLNRIEKDLLFRVNLPEPSSGQLDVGGYLNFFGFIIMYIVNYDAGIMDDYAATLSNSGFFEALGDDGSGGLLFETAEGLTVNIYIEDEAETFVIMLYFTE